MRMALQLVIVSGNRAVVKGLAVMLHRLRRFCGEKSHNRKS